jgi:Mg/Co/Ni transporter MgtE
MTIKATRALLLRNLLRSGDSVRLARLLDRLAADDVARLVADLEPHERRRVAAILLDEQRAAHTVEALPRQTLDALVCVATADASERVAALTRPAPRSAGAVSLLSGLRLRRLFS